MSDPPIRDIHGQPYNHGERGYELEARVVTALYGDATVISFRRDRTIGWVYQLRLDDPIIHGEADGNPEVVRECWLVESALTGWVPAVDQLGDLAR